MKQCRLFQAIVILAASTAMNITIAQSADVDSSYFPLQIGVQRTYNNYLTEKVTDTARIRGRLFYTVNTTYGSPTSSSKEWFRSSNDTIYVLQISRDTIESPLYYLKANVRDSVNLVTGFGCTWGTTIRLGGKDVTVSTPSGTYQHCLYFSHYAYCFDGGMRESWLAKGVGVVKWTNESFVGMQTSELTSYSLPTSVRRATIDVNTSSGLSFDGYADPFNSQATLTYRIIKGGRVNLGIFDVLGREIAQLVNEQEAPGTYHLSWNAAGLSSNTYFAVLRANDVSIIKKLVLR
jgi:hypothetical protein